MSSLLQILLLQSVFSLCRSQASGGLFIAGGLSKIYLHDQTSSPILAEVELFGCTDSPLPLPTYPRLVFGASQVWTNTGSLLLCGGADWSGPSNKCFKWSPRSVYRLNKSTVSLHLADRK